MAIESLRLLFTCGDAWGRQGGVSRYVANVAPALAALGHDVHVMAVHPSGPDLDEVREGVSYHFRSLRRIRLGVGRVMGGHWTRDIVESATSVWLETRALRTRFDVIESADWGAEGLAVAHFGGAPMVVNLHSPLLLTARYNGWTGRDIWGATTLEQRAIRRAAAITSVSTILTHRMRQAGFSLPESVQVIPNPTPLPKRPADVIISPPIVVIAGRVEPYKGSDRMVEAAALLRSAAPEARFCFLGGGHPEYVAALKEKAVFLGARCEFLGRLEWNELDDQLRNARLLAIPSNFESAHYGGIQAMALGIPVATTPFTGVAEFIKSSGSGSVAETLSPQALADAILPYVVDPALAATVGQRGRVFAATELDPTRIAERRAALYDQVRTSR